MAFRPIICGVAAGVDGGAVGAIGLGAVAGATGGVTAAPATANATAPLIGARLARLRQDLPHGPGLIRARRPLPARKSSFDDGGFAQTLVTMVRPHLTGLLART